MRLPDKAVISLFLSDKNACVDTILLKSAEKTAKSLQGMHQCSCRDVTSIDLLSYTFYLTLCGCSFKSLMFDSYKKNNNNRIKLNIYPYAFQRHF